MMYITRHSKARRMTNQDFQVARYLPIKDSVALATYLIYIRPLTDMIHRACFDTNTDRKHLFSSAADPDKHWKPYRLTAVLRKLAKDVCGIELGVQVYRQLSIAVSKRHLAQISKPFNRFDDKTLEANRDVAFAWQSGHRPMRRGVSYGLDAAYPDSLQPALLRVYKWTSDVWHDFLDQGGHRGEDVKEPTKFSGPTVQCDIEPQKRRCTIDVTIAPRSPTVSTTSQRFNAVDVDLTPAGANAQVCADTATTHAQLIDCEIPDDFHRERTTVVKAAASTPTGPRYHGLESDGVPSPSASATQTSTASIDRAPARQLFKLTSVSSSNDGEMRAPAQLTDADVFRQFEYLGDYKLLICKSHGYAIRNVKRHLEEQHLETKVVNKAAAARLTRLEIHDPRAVELPATPMTPFASLSPPVGGYFCGGEDGKCGFLSTNDQAMSRHWKTAHGSSKARERLKHGKEVKLQSFSPIKSHARWFVVDCRITAHSDH
jgi:hypothetical protein